MAPQADEVSCYAGVTLNYGLAGIEPPSGCVLLPLNFDEETAQYLDGCQRERPSRSRVWLRRGLTHYMSDFDANGLTSMYPMFMLSRKHAELLLDASQPGSLGRLLDVGAGSGDVTHSIAPLFNEVTVTEQSWAMARRLKAQGYVTHRLDVSKVEIEGGPFDVVTAFNVLDRCANPHGLLRGMSRLVTEAGLVVVSIPLPYDPVYYRGPVIHEPRGRLGIRGDDFAASATSLLRRALPKAGFRPVKATRLPYLSGGDRNQDVYVLDALVCVCKKAPW